MANGRSSTTRGRSSSNWNMGKHSVRMNDIVDQLQEERDKIEQAITLLSGGISDQRFNTAQHGSAFRSRFRGSSNTTGGPDGRTRGGREEFAEEHYDYDLQSALQDARITGDGSIDTRDRAGRWLQAEGYIDNQGFPATQEAEQAFTTLYGHLYDQEGNFNGNRGGGRSFGEAVNR